MLGINFNRSVSALLILTAIAKLWALTGHSTLFLEKDPLAGITFGALLAIAAALELGVAAICFFRPKVDGLFAVAWLSTVFLGYRIGLWWIGWKKPCSCLGTLTDALHISPQLADDVMKGVLAFMLIGSVSLLIAHLRRSRAAGSSPASPVPEPKQA